MLWYYFQAFSANANEPKTETTNRSAPSLISRRNPINQIQKKKMQINKKPKEQERWELEEIVVNNPGQN